MTQLKKIALLLIIQALFACEKEEMYVQPFLEINNSFNVLNDDQFIEELYKEINSYRLSKNLTSLELNNNLPTTLASMHCNYLVEANVLSHEDFNLRRNTLLNNGATSVGENIARGYTNAKTLVNAWSNSPSHRTVLEGNYTTAGISIQKDKKDKYYFVLLVYR